MSHITKLEPPSRRSAVAFVLAATVVGSSAAVIVPAAHAQPMSITSVASSTLLSSLKVSTVKHAANAPALHGANLDAKKPVYVWLEGPSDWKQVNFHIDGATTPHQVERKAPWDLVGGAAFDVTTLSQGAHSITVVVTDKAGKVSRATANFTVGQAPVAATSSLQSQIRVSTVKHAANAPALHGANLDAKKPVYVWLEGPSDWKQVNFHIDGATTPAQVERKAPWDLVGGAAFDVTTLSQGAHSITVVVTDKAGKVSRATANFTVGQAPVAEEPVVEEPVVEEPTLQPLQKLIRVSTTSHAADAPLLQGASLPMSAPVYIWADGPADWQQVDFTVNGANTPLQVERRAPWDFVGGGSFDLSTLGAGQHTVSMKVKDAKGTVNSTTVGFTVVSDTPAPTPTPEPSPTPTPTPEPEPTPAPVVSNERPGLHNTGPKPGVVLKKSGTITVTQDNAVIENLAVDGIIKVQAHNVTIRNVHVRTNTNAFAIRVYKGFAGTRIENCKIELGIAGTDAHAATNPGGDFEGKYGKKPGDNVTMRYCSITGYGDGISASNWSLYEHNYIKVTRTKNSDNHVDGIQASGRSGITIRNNFFDLGYAAGHNAAVFVQAFMGRYDNHVYDVTVNNNWMSGGVYTFHSEDGKFSKNGYLHNIRVFDNVFYRTYKYGPVHIEGDITGNFGRWFDTGELIR